MPPSPDRISRAHAREGKPFVGGLTLGSLLHTGALFDVYELSDSARVAKILLPEVDAAPAELRRALAISDDVDHPRALGITDAADSKEGPYAIANRIDGESLLALALRRPGRVPPGEAVRIVGDATEIVLAAHHKNLVHAAISASHVLLSASGGVYVMGFGESRLRERVSPSVSNAFEAPELGAKDAIATPASDQWALAATLFVLLTGESPYGGKADQARTGSQLPRRLSDRYPLAPRPLARLLDRGLAVDPDQRYPDVGAFLAALRNAHDIREVHYALPLRSPLAKEGDGAPPLVPSREPLSPPRLSPLPSMPEASLPTIVTPPPPSDTRVKFSDLSASVRARALASTVPAPAVFEPVHIAETDPPDAERHPMGLLDTDPPRTPTPLPEQPQLRVRSRADTQPAISLGEPSPPSVRRRREADLLLGITTSDDSETEALERVLAGLARAVGASQEHGPDSAALNTALPPLMELIDLELIRAPAGLAFRVEADRLSTQARTVWEPPGALSIAISRLASAGVRTLALLPGLDAQEIAKLVDVFAARDGFGTDIVTELYDADFAHVLFHAPDPLSGFATEARRGLEKRQRQLLALVDFDTGFQLEDAWQEARKHPGPRDVSERLDVMSTILGDTQSDVLRGEPLERETDLDLSRLSHIMSSALRGPTLDLALVAFAPRIREILEDVAVADAKTALTELGRMIEGLRAPEATLEQRRDVFRALASGTMLKTLFRKLSNARAEDEDLEALALLVPLLDAELAASLVSTLPAIVDHRLRAQVLHHLEFGISGHEAALGDLAQEADPQLGLEITRLLGRIETLAAKNALDSAAQSPFAVIRIEALGLRGGASGERLRGELKRLLEDAPSSERIMTLRAIRDAEVRFAAPFLALRVRSPKFDSLEYEEKRLVFNALVVLAPARAEALALDLLDQNRLLPSARHEDSRALAAEALGRTGASEDVLETLAEHTRWRIGTSERVRSAAEAAHAAVKRRLSDPELPASPVPSQRAPKEKERPRDE
jgi:serine/threonine protein kinase